MKRAILLDRDGVINQDSLNYIKSVDELILIPSSVQAIAQLTQAGYAIGIATNQSGVSRGLYNEEVLWAIHDKLCAAVEAGGGRIDAIEYCIHLPDAQCACRKPQSAMLKALANRLNCTLEGTPFVGDRVSDILAAQSVNALPIMVLSSMTDVDRLKSFPEVPIYHSLAEYVDQLLHSN